MQQRGFITEYTSMTYLADFKFDDIIKALLQMRLYSFWVFTLTENLE